MDDSMKAVTYRKNPVKTVREIVEVLCANGYIDRSIAEATPVPEPPDVVIEIINVLRAYGVINKQNEVELGPQPEPPDMISKIIAVLHQYGYVKIHRMM